MGAYVRQTLIVTGTGEQFHKAYTKALSLFNSGIVDVETRLVSEIVDSFNGYMNFSVFDCGSKLGWGPEIEFKSRMNEMTEYLKSNDCIYSDGSSCNDWVLVEYGDTGRRVKKSNCKNLL